MSKRVDISPSTSPLLSSWGYNVRVLLPTHIKRPTHPMLVALIMIIAIVGAIATVNTYMHMYADGIHEIVEHSTTFSHTIDAQQVAQLSGSAADIGTSAYEELKRDLIVLHEDNPDAHFVYLVSIKSSVAPILLVDSESSTSPDYSPPGQVYNEAPPELIQTIKDGIPRVASYSDRWGSWESAYAPVRDETGAIVAIVGADTEKESLIYNAVSHAAVPALSTLVLIVMILSFQIIRAQELAFIEKKTQFLSIASHEIRTPLTGIRWAIEGLLEDTQDILNKESRDILIGIYDNSNILLSRVNNILDLASLDSAEKCELQPTELKKSFDEVLSSLMLSAKQKNVALVLDPSIDDKVVALFDPQLMRHVFFNLISNAIKYTKNDTTVTISYAADGAYNVIKIADQGPGISPEDQQKIFTGFERGAQKKSGGHEGTGLGLYLVKRIVMLHKGTIAINSTEGTGTTFVIRLPA